MKAIKDYDNNGNLIHERFVNGFEYWREFDQNNKMTHYRNSISDIQWWIEYDTNGNEIHFKNSDGYEYWQEYDNTNHMIRYRNTDGVERWYDEKGDVRESGPTQENTKHIKEYDAAGNLIHERNYFFEYWREIDEKNNLIYFRNSLGDEWWQEYDANGNAIYFRTVYGYESWTEFDENNKMLHFRDTDGKQYWYDENGKIYTRLI
jgi:YD repeat-containing protein